LLKIFLLAEVFLAVCLLSSLAPNWPRTPIGWLLVVLVGPPVFLALLYLGERVTVPLLFSNPLARWVKRRPEGSPARILYLLNTMLLFVATLYLAGHYMNAHFAWFRVVGELLDRNFYWNRF